MKNQCQSLKLTRSQDRKDEQRIEDGPRQHEQCAVCRKVGKRKRGPKKINEN